MNIWFSLPLLSPDALRSIVQCLDGTGVTGVTIADHLCVPDTVRSPYPYGNGVASIPSTSQFSDPLALAAGLGDVAPGLRYMTSVLLVPLWHPVQLARQVATVSLLLGGRLELGVGAGWMREEFAVVGVPFDERGPRLEEAVGVMRRLWSEATVEHAGTFYAFDALEMRPRPDHPVPILIGGHSHAAVRRAARLGDGWVGINPDETELARIANQLTDAGRSGAGARPFAIRTGIRGPLIDERLASASSMGVTDLIVFDWQLPANCRGPALAAPAAADALSALVERVAQL